MSTEHECVVCHRMGQAGTKMTGVLPTCAGCRDNLKEFVLELATEPERPAGYVAFETLVRVHGLSRGYAPDDDSPSE